MKSSDVIVANAGPPNCPHEHETPEVWWADLALRLKKAVYVFSEKTKPRATACEASKEQDRNIAEVMAIFEAAEKEALGVARVMAGSAAIDSGRGR